MPVSPPYRVEYQVFSVVYFKPDSVISCTDFCELWSRTSAFGKETAHGNFWHKDGIPSASKSRSYRLGAMDRLHALIEIDPTKPIYGGAGRCQRTGRTTDCDFYFGLDDGGRTYGYETPPVFMMGLSGQWLERSGTTTFLENLREQLIAIDRAHAPYGFVDVAASEDCYSGFVYVSYTSKHARLHRVSEHIKFSFAASHRRDQARGVYWGNYFGEPILNRLGGRTEFLNRFREQAKKGAAIPDGLSWEFENGVFVSLSLDPIDCKPGPPISGNVIQNLHWLLVEMGSKGVLNPWADDGA